MISKPERSMPRHSSAIKRSIEVPDPPIYAHSHTNGSYPSISSNKSVSSSLQDVTASTESIPHIVTQPVRDEEEEEFDEDNDILEFKLNAATDEGIMRSRPSADDGVPVVIRHSTSSKTELIQPKDHLGRNIPHHPRLFEQADIQTATANDALALSDYSHQTTLNSQFRKPFLKHDPTIDEQVDENGSEAVGGEWQDMKTVGSYEVYDERGNLIVHRNGTKDEEQEDAEQDIFVSAAKGYTRVTLDEDAKSVNSMDENTEFLFDDDELNRDPLLQLQATKDMLTDSQKIAYVGLCRLILVSMADTLRHIKAGKKATSILNTAHDAISIWSQKMMIRLYSHLDISSEEQIMIEQLAEHGVLPSDLSPSLLHSAKVKNPMARSPSLENHSSPTTPPNAAVDAPADAAGVEKETLDSDPSDFNVQRPEELSDQKELEIDVRWTILCDLFLVLLSDSIYDSRSRTLLTKAAQILQISSIEVAKFERKVTDALEIEEGSQQKWNESDIMEKRRIKALKKKYMYVGLATLGGGLVIGLSAGILAPVIGAGLAAGFTTVGVTGTGGFLAGAGGAALVTSTGAAVGAKIGLTGMAKRMGHVRTFEYRPLHNHKRVNLIITVSGWMLGREDDVRLPFSTVDPVMGDLFSVLWEPEMLRSMGQTINILATEALTQSIQQILGQTVLTALMASIQLPMALSKLGYLLDNPWNVSLDRAWSSGLILADSLIERNLGLRPVTLVGFSLGARVVYSCLVELSRRKAYGLVQDVFIYGGPIVIKRDQLALAKSIVSGRFVNGYSQKDWILGYLFRATSGGLGRVAGLAPIEVIRDIENYDCTDLIEGHMAYRKAIPILLKNAGWEVLSEEFTEIEDPDPERQREKQRELKIELDEARKQMEAEVAKEQKKGKKFFSWLRPKNKEWWEMAERDKEEQEDEPNDGDRQDGNVMFDVEAIKNEIDQIQPEAEPSRKIIQPIPQHSLSRVSEEYRGSDDGSANGDVYEDDEMERNAHKPVPVKRASFHSREASTISHSTYDHDEADLGTGSVTMTFDDE